MASVSNVNNAAASGSIDSRLYKAAVMGEIKAFQGNQNQQHLDLMTTPIKSTVLHIYIMSPNQTLKSTEFVKQILELCPALLLQPNANGDIPLHVAAKYGHSAIVEILLEHEKAQHDDELQLESGIRAEGAPQQMLSITNGKGNTALHEAVWNGHIDVVKILTKEDPDFSYSANHFGETPLYTAADRNFLDILAEILETCNSVNPGGPCGSTALHVAVQNKHHGMATKIIEKKKSLTKETDQHGWTPLHYAAYYGSLSILKLLLESDFTPVYIADKDKKMTALHMAASQGYQDIMREIIFHCPDCCEMVDHRGWNVLHFAMTRLTVKELRSLITDPSLGKLITNLMNRKDDNGNTPLHVLAACRPEAFRKIRKNAEGNLSGLNKHNESALFIYTYGSPQLEGEILELSKVDATEPYRRGIIRRANRWKYEFLPKFEKAKASRLVVAALIATVTFAAAFTMPGGYKSEEGPDQGIAILIRKTAFQAFIITDALAMILSLLAVYFHFTTVDIRRKLNLYVYAGWLTEFAMIAMVVAFATGIYAVLSPSSGLAIVTCLVCLSFFVLMFALISRNLKWWTSKDRGVISSA